MPYIISTYNGLRGTLSGQVLRCDPASFNNRTRMFLPPAVSAMRRYASHRIYGSRLYAVGHFTENVLVDEHYRLLRQGIRPPLGPPTVSVGAGATEQICYLSFWDELTGERSSLSEGTALLTGNTTRTWSNLPTSVPGEILRAEGLADANAGVVTGVGGVPRTNFDMFRPGDRVLFSGSANRWATIRTISSSSSMTIDDLGINVLSNTLTYRAVSRVSHIECWVSVAGTLPRLAARVRLGTTGFVESVPTLSLGEAFLENFEPMPAGRMNTVYGDRQLVAGVERARDEVFLSQLFFPERFGGLSFRTRYGEPITGILGTDDYALINTPDSSYILQGYTEDDLTMTVSNPSLGAFGHVTSIAVEQNLWIPNRKNFYMYTGAWKAACEDRQTEWNDAYQADPTPFEEGLTVYNPNDSTIQFYPFIGSGTLPFVLSDKVWLADFSSVKFDAGGEIVQPMWMNDSYGAIDSACYWGMAAYLIPDGHTVGKFYRVQFGTTNGAGKIYYEDPAVAYSGEAVVRLPHYLFSEEADDAGGDSEDHGWKMDTLWIYLRSEESAWQLGLWPGDEYAGVYSPTVIVGGLPEFYNVVQPPWIPGFVQVAASQAGGATFIPYDTGPIGGMQNIQYRLWAPKTVHFFRPMMDGRGFTVEIKLTNPKNVAFLGLGGKVIPGRSSRGLSVARLSSS